jgi:hypothetical protein
MALELWRFARFLPADEETRSSFARLDSRGRLSFRIASAGAAE